MGGIRTPDEENAETRELVYEHFPRLRGVAGRWQAHFPAVSSECLQWDAR